MRVGGVFSEVYRTRIRPLDAEGVPSGEWLYLEGGDLDLYWIRWTTPAMRATRRAVALHRRRRHN